MPDNDRLDSDQSKTESGPTSEIEQILEQEEKGLFNTEPLPATSVTESVLCERCHKEQTNHFCPTCHQPFCEDCRSILDSDYCKQCINEPGAEVKVITPLTDTDGEHHEGRQLIPSGPVFGTMCKRISEMSMYELEAHVDHYKDLVKQAEVVLDFRRIHLGASQLEFAQRKDIERRRLRGVKIPHINPPPKTAVSTNGKAKVKIDPIDALAKVLGCSHDAALKIFLGLVGKPKSPLPESKK